MTGGYLGKILSGIGLLAVVALLGCGGGGGGGSNTSDKPPLPPWTLNIYQSPGGEKLAEGTLTNSAPGQYQVSLAGEAYALGEKQVALSAGKVELSIADQKEVFAPNEFQREMARLAQGRAAQLHSLSTHRVYAFAPVK
jgi:hypothetical protein